MTALDGKKVEIYVDGELRFMADSFDWQMTMDGDRIILNKSVPVETYVGYETAEWNWSDEKQKYVSKYAEMTEGKCGEITTPAIGPAGQIFEKYDWTKVMQKWQMQHQAKVLSKELDMPPPYGYNSYRTYTQDGGYWQLEGKIYTTGQCTAYNQDGQRCCVDGSGDKHSCSHIAPTMEYKTPRASWLQAAGYLTVKSEDIDETTIQNIKEQFEASIGNIAAWKTPIIAMDADAQVSYDALMQAIEAGNYNAMPPSLVPGSASDPDAFTIPIELTIPKSKECVCGGKKSGHKDYAPGHSDWCDVAPGKE